MPSQPIRAHTAGLTFALLAIAAAPLSAQCSGPVQKLIDDRKFDEARSTVGAGADDRAQHCLGMIDVQANRTRDAIGHFEKAVKLNDQSALHHLWLGNALGNVADSTSKIKLPFLARRVKSEFDRAVELDPKSIDARHGLIQFYSQAPGVMGGSMDKAKDQAREIGKLNPMRGHYEMANLFARDKKTAEAEQELIAAERESPDSAVASYWLGSFYQNQARWPDAFAVYDRMLKKYPGEANVHLQIGRAAAISGEQLERGERELKIWLASPPKDAVTATISNVHWRLGMIHEKQGKKDVARSDYGAALSINPSNENVKKSLAALK
jgi:tetratricopeptide (TPR) repeat protein